MSARKTHGLPPFSRAREALRLRNEGNPYSAIAYEMRIAERTARNLVSAARSLIAAPQREPQDLTGLDDIDQTPGCPRCGLRGSHECLPERAEAYLGRRGEQLCVRNKAA